MKELPAMINPNSVDAIVERCEQFTRDNLRTLCDELRQLQTGEKIEPDSKFNELLGKLSLIGHKQPPVQIAIAMISNESVKFVVANTNANKPAGEVYPDPISRACLRYVANDGSLHASLEAADRHNAYTHQGAGTGKRGT